MRLGYGPSGLWAMGYGLWAQRPADQLRGGGGERGGRGKEAKVGPPWVPRPACWSGGVGVEGKLGVTGGGVGRPGRHNQVRRARRRLTGRGSVRCAWLGDGR